VGSAPVDAGSSTAAREAREAAPPAAPRLADGVELLGRFEDSGFIEPPYLARRGDGQVLQLTPLLHHLADAADGRRTTAEIAERVGATIGKHVTADNIEFLVAEKLRPLGVLAAADGSSPPMAKADPLLALRHRRRLVSEGAVWRIAGVFAPLFAAPVVAGVLLALLAFDVYVLLDVGVGGGLRQALYEPTLLLGLFAATIVATAFHEVGHAGACRYGGARPGAMGAAIYVVWPAFFCDVTDAYRLDRRGRLRTDLGGVYFNAVFCVAVAGTYLVTRFEPLVLLLVTQHLLVLQQLLPLLRFDGYYVLSDLTGVPDMLGRVKPVLRSLLPGRGDEPRVAELKPRARRTVRVYVVALVPLVGALLVMMVLGVPRMVATAGDALGLQVDRLDVAVGAGRFATAALAVVQSISLVLPLLGAALSVGRFGRRSAVGLVRWAQGSAWRAGVGLAGSLAFAAGLAALWWPNGEYEPLRPGERGTLREVVQAASAIPTGRPSFTPDRAVEYRHVPTVREEETSARRSDAGEPRGDEPAQPGASRTTPATADGETSTTPQDEASDDPGVTTDEPPSTNEDALGEPPSTTTLPAEQQPPTTTVVPESGASP
jgi:putative peptide zinc metalloprotease protein